MLISCRFTGDQEAMLNTNIVYPFTAGLLEARNQSY